MLVITLAGNLIVGPMIVVPVGALLALAWASASCTPLREIGYVRPHSWTATLVGGAAFGIVLKLVMKAIVMPLFGAEPSNQAYRFLVGNTAWLPTAALSMIVVGFAEETVFRGYLFNRFGRILGHGVGARLMTVAVTSAWFALAHYGGQGIPGVQQALVVGAVFGLSYAFGIGLVTLMAAHAAFDLTALALIFSGLETRVARLLFN